MNLYVGIDLHSTNSYIGVIDDKQRKVIGQRLPNDKKVILNFLEPYRDEIVGAVVESTYNWYWLVDALMAASYRVHLANPSAIQQYEGIKYLNDKQDAFWLAKMLQLGILPEGYIYPKEVRGVRDLLRQRSRLVQKRTALKLMLQQSGLNQTGVVLTNNTMERFRSADDLQNYFDTEDTLYQGINLLETILFLKSQITKIESYVSKKMKSAPVYSKLLTIPGVGKTLGLTISLETGPIERFKTAGDYASYCRCVPSSYWSNDKQKGKGNQKNGNKYLAWAYSEAANFCIRYNPEAKSYYQRKSAHTKAPVAYRAIANKLSKACYYMMRDGVDFDAQRLFGN